MTTDAAKRMAQVRTKLITDEPFYAMIGLKRELVPTDTLPTAATDGVKVYYNPDFIMSLSFDEALAVYVHELDHIARLHMFRRGSRDPKKWNIACDMTINYDLPQRGYKLPADCVPGQSGIAEELYAALPEDSEGEGDGPGGIGSDVLEPGTNPDGSGQPLPEHERRQLEERTIVDVKQAAEQAKRMGKLPAGMEEHLNEVLTPRVPWRTILAHWVAERVDQEYTYTRLNKRFLPDLALPTLDGEALAPVALALDTSGSTWHLVQQIASEAVHALQCYEQQDTVEIPVLWFDWEVYPQLITDADELQPRGGGGTNFAPVSAWLQDNDGFEGCVIVTDGHCDSFGEAPPCDVLWILTERNRHFHPPYGEVAYVM